jgi:hypothetical protein
VPVIIRANLPIEADFIPLFTASLFRGNLKRAAATIHTMIAAFAAMARRTRLRTRLAAVSLALLITITAMGGLWILSAAQQTEAEADALIDRVLALSAGSLLEPDVYQGLAEQAEGVGQAASRLHSRMSWLQPLEFLPIVGEQIQGARNAARVTEIIAGSTTVLGESAATALYARRTVGNGAFTSILQARKQEFALLRQSLDEAERLLSEPTIMNPHDLALTRGTILTFRTLTIIALEYPLAIEDGIEVVQAIFDLNETLNDPWSVLLEIGSLSDQAVRIQFRTQSLVASVSNLTVDGFLTPDFGRDTGLWLGTTQSQIEAVTASWNTINAQLLQETFSPIEGSAVSLDRFGPIDRGLQNIEDGIVALGNLLGYDAPKTYLLLLQDQKEIRATGEFIGIVVEVPIMDGVLGDITVVDSTKVDRNPLINNPPAPEPLYWYLWMGRLLFRDANWNPHFPVSAETIIELYEG